MRRVKGFDEARGLLARGNLLPPHKGSRRKQGGSFCQFRKRLTVLSATSGTKVTKPSSITPKNWMGCGWTPWRQIDEKLPPLIA
jgi:hypothetical protein